MNLKLKKGDRVKMREDAPSYKSQGILEDGTYDTGTITSIPSSNSHYIVSWDKGSCGLCYNDDHIEAAVPKIINNYQIY